MKEKKFTQYKDDDVRISFAVLENCTFHDKSALIFSKTKAKWEHSNYLRHKEDILENVNKWSKNNWDKVKGYKRKWVVNNRKHSNIIIKRGQVKRKKELGYIPLNDPKPGYDGHHIDKDRVLFIPKELHQSVWHNVHSGHNMNTINRLAWDWIYKTDT